MIHLRSIKSSFITLYVTHMIGPLGRCLVEEMWYSINVLFWRLKDFCCCCSRYCLPRTSLLENWRPGTACISIWSPKFLRIWIHCSPWSNLTQEIQFLEFTGGSNLTHAHSNYLICMRFIRMITVINVLPSTNKRGDKLLKFAFFRKELTQVYMKMYKPLILSVFHTF